MKYVSQGKLSISVNLLEFVNKELLPDTNVDIKKFWKDFDKTVHELAPRNRELLSIREKMQKQIDLQILQNLPIPICLQQIVYRQINL